jgi:hypothetical protein
MAGRLDVVLRSRSTRPSKRVVWTGQTLAINLGRETVGAPVRRRGVRTGGAGRLPRGAPRSHPWQAGESFSGRASPS